MNQIITKKFQTGEADAIDIAFRAYYKQLVAFAYTFTGSSEEAEDLVQDCFAKLLLKKDRWHQIHDVRSYLFKMVQNNCFVSVRKKGRAFKITKQYAVIKDCIEGTIQEPEILSRISLQENAQIVDRLLSVVTCKRKKALRLVYLNEQNYLQSAKQLGISVNTLKTTLQMAKRDILAKFPRLLPLIILFLR